MIYRENKEEPDPCIGCGEKNYVAHNVTLCAACKEVCQKTEQANLVGELYPNENMMETPRKLLHYVDSLIEEHMRGDKRLDTPTLDWAMYIQRATRLYLYQLGAPEAQSYWGKWKTNAMRHTWGNVKS